MATKRRRGTDSDGRPVWLLRAYGAKSQTFHGSERDADKELAKYAVAVDKREVAKPSADTMAPLFEEWYEDKAWKSIGAKKNARQYIDRYFVPHFGELRRSRFNEDRITKLYKGLQTAGPKCLAKRGGGSSCEQRAVRSHAQNSTAREFLGGQFP